MGDMGGNTLNGDGMTPSPSVIPALARAVAQQDRAVRIVLLGEPVAFARTRHGKTGALFTPTKQRNTMAALKIAAQQAMIEASYGQAVFGESVRLDFLAVLPIPASKPKKWQAAALAGQVAPAKKPDLSNLCKLAEDALNGVVFADDKLIVDASLSKRYGVQPRIEITVAPWQPDPTSRPEWWWRLEYLRSRRAPAIVPDAKREPAA